MRRRNVAKINKKRGQIANISELLYEIDAIQNDGDDRIRTGSTSNDVYEMMKNGSMRCDGG